jgi:hypothetical protein
MFDLSKYNFSSTSVAILSTSTKHYSAAFKGLKI